MNEIRVSRISIHRVRIPTGGAFEHSAGSRSASDSFVCSVELEDGVCGYGEGVARPYVTGETPEDCWTTLSSLRLAPIAVHADMAQVVELADRVTKEAIPDGVGVVRNGGRCALEMALLDAYARRLNVPLGVRLSTLCGTTPGPVCSHTLTIGRKFPQSREEFQRLLAEYGFTAAKVKVGFGLEEDRRRVAWVREVMGPKADVRLDANRAWTRDEATEFMKEVRPLGVAAVEDPVQGEGVEEQAEALRRLREHGVEIILDESVRTLEEADLAVKKGVVDTFNIRVSKNGGLIGALNIARLAQRERIGIQVGCQVAETAILSAAGRCLAYAAGPVRYMEGSNERLKYTRDQFVCLEDLTYGNDARSLPLDGPGLGITVLPERVQRFSVQSARIL